MLESHVMAETRSSLKGFTIVELLIVIIVIATLAAITIVAYNGIQQRARDTQRKSDVTQITKGLSLWSTDTGGQFATMNTGNGGTAANGWFDANYGGGSVQEILQNGKYIANNVKDPKQSASETGRWRYMIAPCVVGTDNRRVVMVELEVAPAETVATQASRWGCDSPYISSYATHYRVNYIGIADAR